MTVFPLQLTPFTKPLVAMISVHGLTDLDSTRFVLPYATCLSIPLPSSAITAVFCVASLYHFSEDVGVRGSMYVHSCALFAGVTLGTQAAFMVMIVYMAFVHTPFHYLRCCLHSRAKAAKIVSCFGLLAAAVAVVVLSDHAIVELSDFHQRIAISHIFCESSFRSPQR